MLDCLRNLELQKKKSILAITSIYLLFCIVCLAYMIKPNVIYEYNTGDIYIGEDMRGTTSVLYDGISLTPGVYDIRVFYETDTDRSAVCSLQDGSVFHGGLLTNGEHLYRGLHHTGFHAWLFESTESMQVTILANDQGLITVNSVVIEETDLLWTMLLATISFFYCLILGSLIFIYYDRKYQVSDVTRQAVFFVLVITFLVSLPYLRGNVISGADLTYHLQRIEGVKDGILNGQFPVRIEPRWLYDHGYANAIFYCNLLLIFPAILRILGFPIITAYSVFCIMLNLLGTTIAYVCFRGIFKNHKTGVICCFLYELSVFKIYKLTITGAVGEGSAFTFLPLIIYGYYRVFSENPKGKKYGTSWLLLAFGYAGLIQSHVLTCEITGFLTILLCLVYIRKVLNLRVFFELAKGALGALLLSLWYLVPFLDYYTTQDVHIRHVSARTIQERGLLPAQLLFEFWQDGANTPLGDNGMQYSHPVGIGFVLIAGIIVFAGLIYGNRLKEIEKNQRVLSVTAAAFAGLLLLMSLNVFPWDGIQKLGSVSASLVSGLQFPNRFLGWGTALSVTVCGGLFTYFYDKNKQLWYVALVVAVTGTMFGSFHLLSHVNESQMHFYLYHEEGMGFGYISGAEYLIEGTKEELLTFDGPHSGGGVEIMSYEQKGTKASVSCCNYSDKAGYVDFPLLMYKGYQGFDEKGESLPVTYGNNYLVRVEVPGNYQGTVETRFISPWYWRASEAISLIAILGTGVFIVQNFGRRDQPGKKTDAKSNRKSNRKARR